MIPKIVIPNGPIVSRNDSATYGLKANRGKSRKKSNPNPGTRYQMKCEIVILLKRSISKSSIRRSLSVSQLARKVCHFLGEKIIKYSVIFFGFAPPCDLCTNGTEYDLTPQVFLPQTDVITSHMLATPESE